MNATESVTEHKLNKESRTNVDVKSFRIYIHSYLYYKDYSQITVTVPFDIICFALLKMLFFLRKILQLKNNSNANVTYAFLPTFVI